MLLLFFGDNTASSFAGQGIGPVHPGPPLKPAALSLKNSLQLECVRVDSVLIKLSYSR